MRKIITAIALSVSSVFSADISLLGGSEADTDSQTYSYIGVIGQQGIGEGKALMGKLWIDYLTYSFEHNGRNVDAKAPAFQVSAGFKRTYENWNLTLWLGWERRDTDVDPSLPGVKVKGTKDSVVPQLELFISLNGRTSTEFIVSYSSATSYIWSRARVKRQIINRDLYLGVELLGHGNYDYKAVQSGILAEYRFGKNAFGVRGGYKNSSKGNSAYAGVELYLGF